MLATVPEDAARSVAQSTIAPALTRHVTHYRGKVVGSGALKLSMLHPKLKLTVAAAGATGRGALLAFAGALPSKTARIESLFILFILCSSSMQLYFPSDHLTAYSPSASSCFRPGEQRVSAVGSKIPTEAQRPQLALITTLSPRLPLFCFLLSHLHIPP